MSNLPEVQFKELLSAPPEYGANASAMEFDGKNPRYLRITDIGEDGALLHNEIKSIPRYLAEPYILQDDDITIARTGNTVGKAYLYKNKDGEIAYAGYLIRFKIDRAKADPVFVFQFLHSPYYYSWIERTLRTGAQPNINAAEYCSMLLPGFKLDQQQKIAKILTTIDQLIEKTQALIDKHTAIKQGMMTDLFTRGIDPTTGQLRLPVEQAPHLYKETELGWIPKEWEYRSMSELANFIGGYAFASINSVESGVRWLKISNVSFEKIVWNEESFLPNKFLDIYPEYVLKEGDLVMAMTRPLIRGVAKVSYLGKGDLPALLNQRVGKFCFKEIKDKDYICFIMQYEKIIRQIELKILGTDPPNMSSGQLESCFIPIPCQRERKKIAGKLRSTLDYKNKQEVYLEKLHRQKNGLMQDLLTGKVTVGTD